jgi:hypothetical protein
VRLRYQAARRKRQREAEDCGGKTVRRPDSAPAVSTDTRSHVSHRLADATQHSRPLPAPTHTDGSGLMPRGVSPAYVQVQGVPAPPTDGGYRDAIGALRKSSSLWMLRLAARSLPPARAPYEVEHRIHVR